MNTLQYGSSITGEAFKTIQSLDILLQGSGSLWNHLSYTMAPRSLLILNYLQKSVSQCIASSATSPWSPQVTYLTLFRSSQKGQDQTPRRCLSHSLQCLRDDPELTKARGPQKSSIDMSKLDEDIAKHTEKQKRAPWHREGSSIPPVSRPRSAGAMTKGRS